MQWPPSLDDLQGAAITIAPHVHHTPIMTSASIDELAGASLFFKCENFQKGGAFKMRGAAHAVLSLSEAEASRGVATHSSGNHAAALAIAANLRGIDAHVVMPSNAPEIKKKAVASYGAKITYCEPTLEARESTLKQVVADTGAAEIHPYNNANIIAGQSTVGLELISDVPYLDFIIVPVGGGGLASGVTLAATYLLPDTKVIGVEPAMADDAQQSLATGKIVPPRPPTSVADGLRTALGPLTFELLSNSAIEIVTVTEDEIIAAMRLVWERMKIIIEPSGAVTLAAVLSDKVDITGKRAGVIFSGGNVDLDQLPWLKS